MAVVSTSNPAKTAAYEKNINRMPSKASGGLSYKAPFNHKVVINTNIVDKFPALTEGQIFPRPDGIVT